MWINLQVNLVAWENLLKTLQGCCLTTNINIAFGSGCGTAVWAPANQVGGVRVQIPLGAKIFLYLSAFPGSRHNHGTVEVVMGLPTKPFRVRFSVLPKVFELWIFGCKNEMAGVKQSPAIPPLKPFQWSQDIKVQNSTVFFTLFLSCHSHYSKSALN